MIKEKLNEKCFSYIELYYITFISPYISKKKKIHLTTYYYFLCYIWMLKRIYTNSSFSFIIKKNKKKYTSLVKSAKCHKKGKQTFWLKSYSICIKIKNFLKSDISLNNYWNFFFYLRNFYFNISSNLLFQKRINIGINCNLNFLGSFVSE